MMNKRLVSTLEHIVAATDIRYLKITIEESNNKTNDYLIGPFETETKANEWLDSDELTDWLDRNSFEFHSTERLDLSNIMTPEELLSK